MKSYLKKLKQIIISPSMHSLWCWSAGCRFRLLMLCVGEIVLAGLGLAFTIATKEIIDAAVSSSRGRMRQCIVMLLGIIILQLIINVLVRYENTRQTARLRQRLRAMMVEKVLGKQYSELADVHSGELVGKILTDTGTVANSIVQLVPQFMFLFSQLVGAAIILFSFNPKFVLILVAISIFGALLMAFLGTYMKKLSKLSRDNEDRVLAAVQETMQNLRIIKASETEDTAREKVWLKQEDYVSAELKKGRFSAAANAGISVVFRFSWLYAMLWGCFGICNGAISYGMLTAMLQLVGQVQGPIANLSSLVSQLYSAVSSAERMDELLAKKDEADPELAADSMTADELYASLKEIRLDKLCFSYDRDEVISDCSVSIRPGDITAITGHSGCGKSTFFLLLMGLYSPISGNIRFRLNEIGDVPAGRAMRKLFAYVPQGNALFSGTIKENVSMFRRDAGEDEIWNALSLACIDDFVRGLETGLETRLGEKGLGISEGQAQRIALARAFLSGAPILLLDEATSALDEKTEAMVLENIAALDGKTCLVVTHRPAALKICRERLDFEDNSENLTVV